MKPLILLTTALSLCIIFPAFADEPENYKTDNLTGDWAGHRTSLANAGVDVDVVYKVDVLSNVSGGMQNGTRGLDNLDIALHFDGEKLLGSKGTTALVHFINNDGGKPDGNMVGSAQGIDSFEVQRAGPKLYQAWIQQNFMEDKLSILAGLYDINSEFYLTDSALLFIQSTYGIGTDIAQSGQNGPSIFPYTSVGTRVKIQPVQNVYVQAAVLDGVPGDPGKQRGTQITFANGDGALVVAEAGYLTGGEKPNGKVAVGSWYYTEKFPDFTEVDASGNPLKRRSKGAYVIGEHSLYREQDEKKGLTGFAHLGFADKDVNQFDYAWSAGLVYTGLIPTRDEGQLGFAVNGAHNGHKFRTAAIASGTPVDAAETAFELTYADHLTPWFAVQPDVQYIVNPGTTQGNDNALVLGSRFTVTF